MRNTTSHRLLATSLKACPAGLFSTNKLEIVSVQVVQVGPGALWAAPAMSVVGHHTLADMAGHVPTGATSLRYALEMLFLSLFWNIALQLNGVQHLKSFTPRCHA